MIKQLLNSVLAQYRDLSVAHRLIISPLFATDKSRNFAKPRQIIVYYYHYIVVVVHSTVVVVVVVLLIAVVLSQLSVFF